MHGIGQVSLVMLALGAAPLAIAATTVPAPGDAAFETQVLNAHNAERTTLGEASLAWSTDLAREAARWAAKLAASDQIAHDSQRAHGENIYMGKAGRLTPAAMVAGWIAEKRYYRPGAVQPNVSTTGNWTDVAHYTAIVWSATTAVGCALAHSAKHDFLVCRYDPPGNMPGVVAYDPRLAKPKAKKQ